MNKKTLALVLAIALAIGAFAGLSFNLFSANAETTYVGNGTELVTNGDGADANAKIILGGKGIFVNGVASEPKPEAFTNDADGTGTALKIAPRSGNSTGNRFYTNGSAIAEAGKYVVSFKVYAETAIKVAAGYGKKGSSAQYPANNVVVNKDIPANTWTEISYVADFEVGEYHIGATVSDSASASVAYWIDSFSVQKAVAATPVPTTAPEATPVPVGDGVELVTRHATNNRPVLGGCPMYNSVAVNYIDEANDADNDGKIWEVPPRSGNTANNRLYWGKADVEAGNYIITMYIKFPNATTTMQLERCFISGFTEGEKYPHTADAENREILDFPAGVWTKVTFVTGDVPAGKISFGFNCVGDSASQTMWVDGISVQKVATATPAPTATATPVPVGDGNELVTNGNAVEGGKSQIVTQDGRSNAFYSKNAANSAPVVSCADKDSNGFAYLAAPRVAGGATGLRVWYANSPIPAGTYVFKYSLKSDAAITVKLVLKQGADQYPTSSNAVLESTLTAGQWCDYTYVLEIAESDKYTIGFLTDDATSNNTDFYVDALSMQKAKEATEETVVPQTDGIELIKNNESEDKTPNVNGKGSGFYAPGASSSLKAEAFTGDKNGNGLAYKVVTRSGNSNGNRVYFNDFELEAGQYVFKFYLKAEADMTVKLGFAAGATKYPHNDANAQAIAINANEWTEVIYVTDTLEAGKYAIGFTTNDATSSATVFYIDAMSCQKVGAPSGGNSNAGSSNTGDVLPVAMIVVAVISAGALVIVARRKRED